MTIQFDTRLTSMLDDIAMHIEDGSLSSALVVVRNLEHELQVARAQRLDHEVRVDTHRRQDDSGRFEEPLRGRARRANADALPRPHPTPHDDVWQSLLEQATGIYRRSG
ncbi:MAG: hypothetical protein AAGF12_06025 [Myxococcota bacterium]